MAKRSMKKAKTSTKTKASPKQQKKSSSKSVLYMFYGKECPHCEAMMPLVDQLEKETRVKLVRLEVWHNDKNQRIMLRFEHVLTAACGGVLGVPTFYNTKTKKAVCGEQPYDVLKAWSGKK